MLTGRHSSFCTRPTLSKLEYGCEIYSSATDARLRIIKPVHRADVHLATGAFSSSPIPNLLVDAGVLPLDLHSQPLIMRVGIESFLGLSLVQQIFMIHVLSYLMPALVFLSLLDIGSCLS